MTTFCRASLTCQWLGEGDYIRDRPLLIGTITLQGGFKGLFFVSTLNFEKVHRKI